MPIIGPNRFASSDPTADDLHIIYRGSGGSLAHPKVVEGPQPKSITAKGNRVDVSWEQPLPAGTSVAITVQSDFTFTTPDSFVFTRGGQPLGPWTPYRDESDWRPGHGTIAALRARLAPTSTPRDLEVENRRGERAAFDRARLVGSLVLGNRTAEDSRAAVETLEPLLHAVGHTPISTTALRAAVGEVLLNPRAPDGTAIRDALVGMRGDTLAPRGVFAPVVDGEDELVVLAGRYLEQVARYEAMLAAGERLPESIVGLYDEGVAIHARGVELARTSGQLCAHPMTGLPVPPQPLPPLEALLLAERRIGFVPKALVNAVFAARAGTDWAAVAREVLFKLLGAFGLSDFYGPILEILEGGEFADVWDDLLKALAKLSLKEAIKILIKRFLLSDKFKRLLIEKLGREAAEEILKKIAEKWIPVIGWAALIGNVVAVIIVQLLYFAMVVLGVGPFII